jgi:hypothetical protein
MRRPELLLLIAVACGPPAAAAAETYRAGPLGAWNQNGEFSCEGGELLLFRDGSFAVVPYADDDTQALIDSRSGRAKVGGSVADELERLRADPEVCAGPVECEDWDAVGAAIAECWTPAEGPAEAPDWAPPDDLPLPP